MRLDRLLATLGVGSRSEVQRLIRAGRVTLEEQTVRAPETQVEPGLRLTCDGKALDTRLNRHVMLHKPAGLLTAARDSRQPTVMSLLPPELARLGCMPVGRLDKDTTGLLLLTTDGQLGHRLLAPGRHVDKRYLAQVDGLLTEAHVVAFAQGLRIGAEEAAPSLLQIIRSAEGCSEAWLTIHEGKFHQVKRMFEAVGLHVTALHRDRFGPLALDAALPPGSWRELTAVEEAALYAAAELPAATE